MRSFPSAPPGTRCWDVGIAMGAAAAAVSSETAAAVIVVDRIDRVVEAVQIGRPDGTQSYVFDR